MNIHHLELFYYVARHRGISRAVRHMPYGILQYVANGYGLGVTVNAPEVVRHAGVRMRPLDGFEPVEIVAMWWGEPTPIIQTMLDESKRIIARQWPPEQRR